MPRRDAPKTIDDAQRELERLRREIEHSRDECERLRDETARLARARDRLRREIERLTQAFEAARRAGKRQAAPFSKGAPAAQPHRPGRRPGRRHGGHAHRRPPATIDETIDVPLPAACPHCGGGVTETRIAATERLDRDDVEHVLRQYTADDAQTNSIAD